MSHSTTVVGLDVHKESIVAAVLQPEARRFALTTKIVNEPGEVRKFVDRLARFAPLEFVYEAGPCGYQLHRQMTALKQACTVIAPGLTPHKPGDKVKTDRRDAENLAQLHRAGQLTPVRVPTREEEASRDLTRVREDILVDRLRASVTREYQFDRPSRSASPSGPGSSRDGPVVSNDGAVDSARPYQFAGSAVK